MEEPGIVETMINLYSLMWIIIFGALVVAFIIWLVVNTCSKKQNKKNKLSGGAIVGNFEIKYYCNQCKSQIKEEDVFCINCGNKTDENGRYQKKISLKKKKLRKRAKVCAILSIILGAIGLIPLLNFVFLPIALILAVSALLMSRCRKKIKLRKINIASIIVVSLSLIVSIAWMIPTFSPAQLPTNVNEDELKLINYIIQNGTYDRKEKVYTISEETTEAGIDFTYSIEYSKDTRKLTFKETSYITGGGLSFTRMDYEYGKTSQEIHINMALGSGDVIVSKGIIYPSRYTSSSRTIYSFESSYDYDKLQTICENQVYSMLTHCQLLMIDADTGMIPFGFEKGLFK